MYKSIIVFFFAFGWFSRCFAQDYPIQKYTTHQGLAQMQVGCVLKDSRGIVWAGSYGGLSRFNGETFNNYTVADGLISNFISDIQEDNNGYIWASSDTRGLVRFDGRVFKKYYFPPNVRDVSSPIITDKNEIIIHTNLSFFHVVGDTLLPYSIKNFPKDITSNPITVSYFKKTKSLIIVSNNKVYSYKNDVWEEITFPEKIWGVRGIFSNEMIFENYPASSTKTLYCWNGETVYPFLQIGLDSHKILGTIDQDYVFSTNKNLYFLPKKTTQAAWIAKNPPLASNSNFLNQPDGETLWIPTEKGLWRLTRRGFRQFSEQQVPYCWGVIEDKNKNFYFENFQISLQKFDGKQVKTLPFKDYSQAKDAADRKIGANRVGAYNDWYFKPLRDKYHHLWFPNVGGIARYNYKKWDFYTHRQGEPLAFCIAEDTKRDKIVACGSNQLYTVGTQSPNSIEIIKDTAAIFKGLVMSVIVSKTGDYWFSGKGIGRYSPDNKTFKYYNIVNKKLPTKGILGIYSDWEGRIWAMGSLSGLYLFNPKKDIFEEVLKGYFNSPVSFTEQIDENHLAVGNINGINILNLKPFFQENKIEIKVFNQHNGFMGLEPGQLGSYRDSDGNIWITSGSVLTKMLPKELNLQKTPLKTYITKVGKQAIPFIGENFIVQLPKGQNIATFTVESIGEDKPFRSQFSFRIKGVLNEWSEWQEQNLLMVNNLPNGTHTIEVRSRTGTLETTESSIVTLQFNVVAPFYKSPNFYKYATFIGLLLILGMAYFWKRERRQIVKNTEQKMRIEEQETKVRYLQVQTIQAQMNPHFTFNVLGTLQHLILNNETQRASDNLLKLSVLIRNYLEASILGDEQTVSLFSHEISLSKEIELLKMYVEFEQLQYINRFDYEMIIDGKVNINNYRVPPLIIQPFVENAIKHGLLYKNIEEKGLLSVRFMSLNEDTLICTIEDNGVGRERADEIQQKSLKKYKSRGTQLVKRRVEILNELGYDILISTDNRIAGGTVVTIQIGYK